MKGGLEVAVAALTATVLLLTLVGMAVRFVLLPWMKEHVLAPVRETNRQVTKNGHTSSPPTLLDQVHSVRSDVEGVRDDVEGVRDDVEGVRADLHTAARMFEGHMEASASDRGALWEAVHRLERRRRPWPFQPTPQRTRHDD